MVEMMELKGFKRGAEVLARYTNQREAEPTPFLMQIGKDGRLSLVAGDQYGTCVWRTGVETGSKPQKNGISSKLLLQASKALKGRGVTIQFIVEKDHLAVSTSAGGSISLPYTDIPSVNRPPTGDVLATMNFKQDVFDYLVDGIDIAHTDQFNSVTFEQVSTKSPLVRVASTDNYTCLYHYSYPSSGRLDTHRVTPALFWNALRGATTDAVIRFYESGLQVLLEQFEFSTGFLEGRDAIPDAYMDTFPEGIQPDVVLSMDRKVLIDSIKAVANVGLNAVQNTTVGIIRTDEGKAFVHGIGSGENVSTQTSNGRGTGRCELSGRFLNQILSVIPDREVVLAFHHSKRRPVGIRGKDHMETRFLLAPVVRTHE